MFSRVNFLETPGRIPDVTKVVHEVVQPGISKEPGYLGYIVLGDPTTGKALGITLWESEAARAGSDALARTIRPKVEEATGGMMRSVENFEVLLCDVQNVPEV
ncbi:MAG: hypothetical protein GEU75_00500 [Dehalococcoidia bacterium]|nr:hypothetical protein [Dehalococcoidia bacterium]